MKRFLILLSVFPIVFQCCAKIYYTTDATSLAQDHHLIAIAPATVTIEALRKNDVRSPIEIQKIASRDFQIEMYNQLLERKRQEKIVADIQEVDTSIAILKRAGYYNGTPLSPVEICRTLGVDGIITTDFKLIKPVSEAEALAWFLAVWAAGEHFDALTQTTKTVIISVGINDFKTKKMIWKYDNILSSGILSTQDHLAGTLMRRACRKMPYAIK